MPARIVKAKPASKSHKIEIKLGSCLDMVPGTGPYEFIFADPPFNIDQKYDAYDDAKPLIEYKVFTRQWLKMCWEECNGIIALHGNDRLCEIYLQVARELQMRRIAWVNWHYRFGQCHRGNWIDARCHCLIFSKNRKHTWNPDEVLIESDRATTYNDKRINDTERGGKRVPGTVWGIPSDGPYWGRVTGNSAERCEHNPNQLPELYLARLIKAYTNPGDRVLDPFCGTGTTAVVCDALRRSCLTCDISSASVQFALQRLAKGAVRINPER